MSQMQTMLKNNLRKKKRLFDTLERFVKPKNEKIIIDKKATSQQLKQIREKLQKENRKQQIVFIILFLLVITIMLGWFVLI